MNIRVTLEELMLSFSFDCYTDEDLNLCQKIKEDSDNDKYYFFCQADKEFFTYIVYPKFQEIKSNKEKNNDNPYQNQQSDSLHTNEQINDDNIFKSCVHISKPKEEQNMFVEFIENFQMIENYFDYDITSKDSKIDDTIQNEENNNNKEGEQIKKTNSFSYLSTDFLVVDKDDCS